MNNINDIVFQVYDGVLDMNYSKNQKKGVVEKVKKLIRYISTGYIFEMGETKKLMNEKNHFTATKNQYNDLKIAIYTVSTGGYDNIKEPIYVDENIDYYVFTNQELNPNSIWKKIELPQEIEEFSSLEKARFLKTHPHLFFKNYDYSMFIDGNVQITCDIRPLFYTLEESGKLMAIHRHQVRDCVYDEARAIKAVNKAPKKLLNQQIAQYKTEGFPAHFGLFETNIVIRKQNDSKCISVMETWWNEIHKWTKRDQVSFTYALWKNGLTAEDVLSLGNNSRRNPYFIVDSHK